MGQVSDDVSDLIRGFGEIVGRFRRGDPMRAPPSGGNPGNPDSRRPPPRGGVSREGLERSRFGPGGRQHVVGRGLGFTKFVTPGSGKESKEFVSVGGK